MKKRIVWLVLIALALTIQACTDNGKPSPRDYERASSLAVEVEGEVEFPVPESAMNVVSSGDNVTFKTEMSIEEVLDYYQDAFKSEGLTEREDLTVATDTTLMIVFDGHESGYSVLVQGVDLGDGTLNVTINLRDI